MASGESRVWATPTLENMYQSPMSYRLNHHGRWPEEDFQRWTNQAAAWRAGQQHLATPGPVAHIRTEERCCRACEANRVDELWITGVYYRMIQNSRAKKLVEVSKRLRRIRRGIKNVQRQMRRSVDGVERILNRVRSIPASEPACMLSRKLVEGIEGIRTRSRSIIDGAKGIRRRSRRMLLDAQRQLVGALGNIRATLKDNDGMAMLLAFILFGLLLDYRYHGSVKVGPRVRSVRVLQYELVPMIRQPGGHGLSNPLVRVAS